MMCSLSISQEREELSNYIQSDSQSRNISHEAPLPESLYQKPVEPWISFLYDDDGFVIYISAIQMVMSE